MLKSYRQVLPIVTLLTLIGLSAGAQSRDAKGGEIVSGDGSATAPIAVESTQLSSQSSESGKPRFASVRGIVKDSSGKPVANATVVIGGRLPFSDIVARTSATGEFFADSLNIGDSYSVAIMSLGYRAFESKPFVLQEKKPYSMNFVLKPREVVVRRAKEKSKDEQSKPVVKQAAEKIEKTDTPQNQFISTQRDTDNFLENSMK